MRDEGEKEQERQQIQDIGKTLQFMQRKRNLHHFEENIAYTSHLTTICVSIYIIKVSFGNMSVKSQKYNAQHV